MCDATYVASYAFISSWLDLYQCPPFLYRLRRLSLFCGPTALTEVGTGAGELEPSLTVPSSEPSVSCAEGWSAKGGELKVLLLGEGEDAARLIMAKLGVGESAVVGDNAIAAFRPSRARNIRLGDAEVCAGPLTCTRWPEGVGRGPSSSGSSLPSSFPSSFSSPPLSPPLSSKAG